MEWSHDLRTPVQQVDPYLAILEYLIILVAVTLVVMMVSVYAYAPPDKKIYGRAALAFIIVFATLTCSVHFALLTVGRHIDAKGAPELSRQLSVTDWPTLVLAVELLAWDFCFGLGSSPHGFSGAVGCKTMFAPA